MKSIFNVPRLIAAKSVLVTLAIGFTTVHLNACAQPPSGANTVSATELAKPIILAQASTSVSSGTATDASKVSAPELSPAATSAPAPASSTAPAASSDAAPLYVVKDGNKVDANTYKGFQAWRTGACDRCHGANQEGMVGPSLIQSLKVLTKDDFIKVVRDGRLEKGMVSFGTNKTVMDNIDHLYAYLKGRSDGAITTARVTAIPSN